MSLLAIRDLGVSRAGLPVVAGATLAIAPGEMVGLLGPNGAGKTSLMRAALGLLAHEGYASLAALPLAARARAVAWMPQMREIAWPIPVAEVVRLGRLPHDPPRGALRAEDTAAIEAALARMGLAHLRDRPATALSGGEQARVLIARALAQETPLLMADEPVAGLDPAQALAAMEAFTGLAAEGRGVFLSLHDLGLAARYCTRVVVLDTGRIVADGPPDAVLDAQLLARVFGLRAALVAGAHGPLLDVAGRVQ